MYEDWGLIESSFAEQYGIRLRHCGYMPWTEFVHLLQGINPNTALGSVIAVRTESDPDILKTFTAAQRRIRSEWRSRQAKRMINESPKETKQSIEELQKILATAFSRKNTEEG